MNPGNQEEEGFSLPPRLRQLGYKVIYSHNIIAIHPPTARVTADIVVIGSDKNRDPQAFNNETPPFDLFIDTFSMSLCPLTVAEYHCFCKATNRNPPIDWVNQLNHLDYPVIWITWFDATEYAKWFSEITNKSWRLPTEFEWEKAGRGTDGRIFSWGDTPDFNFANTLESKRPSPTIVGIHPWAASPYGILDMVGNIREWTASIYTNYPYKPESLPSTNIQVWRVIRGGGFQRTLQWARLASRHQSIPNICEIDLGVRLVVD
jgi:formylglycine-generating enzyme required for sulfatase activity